MKLCEIVDIEGQKRNIEILKRNSKRQQQQVKAARARLAMIKAQQQMNQAVQSSVTNTSQ